MVFIHQPLLFSLSGIIEVLEKDSIYESVFDEPTVMREIFKLWLRGEPSLNSVAYFVSFHWTMYFSYCIYVFFSFIVVIPIFVSLHWTVKFRRVGSVCSLQCPLPGLDTVGIHKVWRELNGVESGIKWEMSKFLSKEAFSVLLSNNNVF